MRKQLSLVICLFAAQFTANTVLAQQTANRPLPYNYAYGNLAITGLETGGVDLGGSFMLVPNLHVFASYQDWELNRNIDRSILQVGAGYHWDVTPTLDLVVSAALANSELDTPGPGEIDDDGLILGFGIRNWLSNTVEMSADILLDDSLGTDTDPIVRIGGEYHVSPQFSVGGRVRIEEEDATLFFGVRFYFPDN